MWAAGLDELQAGIKIVRKNINLRYADDSILMAESKELKSRTKELIDGGERGGWESWLETQH